MRGRSEQDGHGSTGLAVALMVSVLGPAAGRAGDDLAAQAIVAQTSLSGTVRDVEDGTALDGVTVVLLGVADEQEGRIRVTDASGFFHFSAVSGGTYRLRLGRAGYEPTADTLSVEPGTNARVLLGMRRAPVIPIAPLDVEVGGTATVATGFERRRRLHHGLFLDRQEIEARAPVEFTDIVRTVPGARIVGDEYLQSVEFRGGCRPTLWVDGAKIGSTLGINDVIAPDALEALEVYRGADIPSEFGNDPCGAIVAWTRRGSPQVERRSLKKQVITAGVILLGFLLIHR